MFKTLYKLIYDFERKLFGSFGNDISTPAGRRAAFWHLHLFDHAFFRVLWSNTHEIAPDVYRSNQPSPARLRDQVRKFGLKSVITLRGPDRNSYFLFEEEVCRELGVGFYIAKLGSRSLLPRERLIELLDLFKTVEKPLLFHCKSGADRAGLAAALYLLAEEGATAEVASRQLGLRYLHRSDTATGVLDHMISAYAGDHEATGIGIREWIDNVYDPDTLQTEFRTRKTRA